MQRGRKREKGGCTWYARYFFIFFPLTNVLTSTTLPPPAEHEKCAIKGALFVFGGSYGLPHPPEHEKHDHRSRFSCLCSTSPFPTHRTHPTRRHQPPLAHPTPPPSAKSNPHNPHNPNTRMCPCGHILVFSSSRTPEHDHKVLWSRSGVWASFPTTLTRRTRPQCRVPRVRDVANTPDMKTRPQCRVFRVWGVPPPSTAQIRRARPYGSRSSCLGCC